MASNDRDEVVEGHLGQMMRVTASHCTCDIYAAALGCGFKSICVVKACTR